MVFFISFSIDLKTSLSDNDLRIIPLVIVSGKPPLLLMITAQPFAAASKLDLPKGSSHREQATAILVFLYTLKTLL